MAFADASVEATADFARFDREFPAELRAAVARASRIIVAEFRKSGTSAGRAFADAVTGQFDRITVAARRSGSEAGRAFRTAAQQFTTNINVGFNLAAADGTRLGQQFRAAAERSTRRIPVSFAVTPSARASGRITGQRFRAGAMEFTTDIPATFDASQAAAQGLLAGRRYKAAAERSTRNIQADVNPSPFRGATRAVAGFTNSLRAALVPLAVIGGVLAAFPVANFIGALLPLTGLLTFLPGLIFGAIGAFTVLGVSIERIGDLIKNNLVPAFAGLRDQIARVVTAGLGPALAAMGRVLAGPVRTGALEAAAALNQVLLGLTSLGRESATANAIAVIFQSITRAFRGLSEALPALIGGMRDLAVAVAPVFDEFILDINSGIEAIGHFLSFSAEGGQAFAWAQAARETLGELVGIVVNLGTILVTVFSTANDIGGNILDTINGMLGSFDQFLKSAAGQQILTAFFTTLQQLTQTLAPVLGQLLAALGRLVAVGVAGFLPLLQVLADLASVLISVLEPALLALSPLFAALRNAVAAILVPLGPIIAQLGTILTQVIEPLATALGDFLEQLGPVIGELVAGLGTALMPLFQALVPIITNLTDSLLPLFPAIVELIPPITEIVISLTPLIAVLAELVVVVLAALAPFTKLSATLIAFLATEGVVPLLGLIADGLNLLLSPLNALIKPLADFSSEIAKMDLLEFAEQARVDLAEVGTNVRDFFANIVQGLSEIPDRLRDFAASLRTRVADAFDSAVDAVRDFVVRALAFIIDLPGRIASALTRLPGILATALEEAFFAGLEQVAFGITSMVIFIGVELPRRLREALAALTQFFSDLWDQAVELTVTGVTNFLTFLDTFPERAIAAISRLLGQIGDFFSDLWDQAVELTVTGIDNLVAFAEGLPERIGQALSTLTVQLVTFFTDLWNQVTATVSAGIDRTVDFFRNLPERIAAFAGRMLQVGRELINRLGEGLSNLGAISGDFAARIIERVRAFINRAIDSIERGINRATSRIGITIDLPGLQSGAVLKQPTVALLAERGPEVVIPLSNPARARQLVDESGLANVVNLEKQSVTNVNVFIGQRELTEIIRVETDQAIASQGEALTNGPRWVGA